MLTPSTANGQRDLRQMLHLQEQNHKSLLTPEQKSAQGFLTVRHTLSQLEALSEMAPQVVVRDGDTLAGYALTMPQESAALVPELAPMFRLLDSVIWKGERLGALPYYVMGQVCVSEAYRGKGVFDALYAHHRQLFQSEYALLVTEIDQNNARSMAAHKRVGFQVAHQYREDGIQWAVVVWDWRG